MSPAICCLLLSTNPSSVATRAAILSLNSLKNRAAVVTTASLEFKEKNRNAILARETFEQIGFGSVQFFDLDASPAQELEAFDLIYLAGGSVHYLLKRLRETGGDKILSALIHAGRPIVASSGGAVVLGHSTAVADIFDPTMETHGFLSRDALEFFPFSLLPHANRWKKTLPDYDARIAATVRAQNGAPLIELTDNEALLIRDGSSQKIEL